MRCKFSGLLRVDVFFWYERILEQGYISLPANMTNLNLILMHVGQQQSRKFYDLTTFDFGEDLYLYLHVGSLQFDNLRAHHDLPGWNARSLRHFIYIRSIKWNNSIRRAQFYSRSTQNFKTNISINLNIKFSITTTLDKVKPQIISLRDDFYPRQVSISLPYRLGRRDRH